MKNENEELLNDIKVLIERFDECLDNMYDRGSFCKEDEDFDDCLSYMKKKYLGK